MRQVFPILPGLVDPTSGPVGGPTGERVWLVSATFFADWGAQGPSAIDARAEATASLPVAGYSFGIAQAGIAAYTLRVATRHFATRLDDPELPSVYWEDRVIDPGSVSLSLPLAPVGDAAIASAVGNVVLDNADGRLDVVFDDYNAVSQTLDIRLGRLDATLPDFVPVLRARIAGIGMTEADVTLELRDQLLYAQNLYPTTVYTGAGGAAGDADLDGVIRPVVLGRVWNVSAVLMDAVNLIFQVHDGATLAVTGVFDGGIGLRFAGNYASYTALLAADVAPGDYATSLAAGLIKVGGTPVFALTCHVDGLAVAGITIRSIATWLIGQLAVMLDLDVDTASLDQLPASNAGWAWSDTFSFGEAINRFVGDGGCYWGVGVIGRVSVIRLEAPDAGDLAASYGPEDIVVLERAPLPDGYEGTHHRRTVRFHRNWTVQSEADLAAAAVNRAFRQQEWRTTTATTSTGARNAIDPPVLETSLTLTTAAADLGAQLLAMHGVPRRMFALETRIFGSVSPVLGKTVRVTHPRFGLREGVPFRVVGLDLRLRESAAHLLLWG